MGYVAVLPIGTARISSVIVTAKVGEELRKGRRYRISSLGIGYCCCISEAESH